MQVLAASGEAPPKRASRFDQAPPAGGGSPTGLPEAAKRRLEQPGAALSFCTGIGWQWLSFLRDLPSTLPVIAVIFCRNDSDAPG
jgi:hypothetical protein